MTLGVCSSHSVADIHEGPYAGRNVIRGVPSGDLNADPRLAERYDRVGERDHIHAALEKSLRDGNGIVSI